MTREKEAPTLGDLNDASDLITTAAALGMSISAPIGSTVYEAYISFTGDYENDVPLGVYATREAAESAATNWVLAEWNASYLEGGNVPWMDEHALDRLNRELVEGLNEDPESPEYLNLIAQIRDAWLAQHSNQEIITLYFKDNKASDTLWINQRTVSGTQDRDCAAINPV